MFVPTAQKPALLHAVLSDPAVERVLVFTRTKHGADKVVRALAAGGIAAAAIHGNKSQPQRERALAGFKSGHCRVLVATDIAARGIDVDGVTPRRSTTTCRTCRNPTSTASAARPGRARPGIAISFCNDEERAYLRDIEKLTRLKVPVAALPAGFAALPTEPARAEPCATGPGIRSRSARASARTRQGRVRSGPQRARPGQRQRPQSAAAMAAGTVKATAAAGRPSGSRRRAASGQPSSSAAAARRRPRPRRPDKAMAAPIGWLSQGASRPR